MIVGGLIFSPEIYNCQLISSVAYAKANKYVGIGEDYASQYESQEIAKLRAERNAIQHAVEQAGIHLKSYSETVNATLTDDEVSAIASTNYEVIGKPKYENIVQQVTDKSTVIVWKATVDVNVDDSEIQNWIKLKDEDKSTIINQNKEVQKAYAENDKQVKDLRERARTATTEDEITAVKSAFVKADDDFLYNKEIEKGKKALNKFRKNSAVNAIQHFNEAIKINPNKAEAYVFLGRAHECNWKNDKDCYKSALEAYSKAIQIDPHYIAAYEGKIEVYKFLKDYDKLIEECINLYKIEPSINLAFYYINNAERRVYSYDKFLKSYPNEIKVYYYRANGYMQIANNKYTRRQNADEEYKKVLEDLNKVIQVNPNIAVFYNTKIWGDYYNGGDHGDSSLIYLERAKCYFNLKQLNLA